jgi:hypothetical protein
MRCKMLLLSLLLLAYEIPCAVFPSIVHADLVWYYQEPPLSGTDGNVISADTGGVIPSGQNAPTVCFGYGFGSVNTPITWQVSDFTGLGVPSPPSQYQSGHDNNWYGSSACQLAGTSAGFMINRDDTPGTATYYGWQLARQWGVGNASCPPQCPWSDGQALRLQLNFDLGRLGIASSVQQSGTCAYLFDTTDTTKTRTIAVCVNMWDSRGQGAPAEQIYPTAGPPTAQTYFDTGMRYSTIICTSQNRFQNRTSSDWYGTYITQANFRAIVADMNNEGIYGGALSTNPSSYKLTEVQAGTEMYSPAGTYGNGGTRIGSLDAMADTGPLCT